MSTNPDHFVLIIGAMKSGTSSLFDWLSQHPEICRCKQKEPNFFSDDSNWSKGFDWYQNLWHWNPNLHRIALEASTHYTKIPKFPNAPERISQIEAKFKFVYILRNPVERIESQYNFGKTRDWGRDQNFSEAIKHCIENSQYAMQLDEYYKKFPSEDILILNFEDLKSKPSALLKKVCKFLNVDASYNFNFFEKAQNLTVVESPLLRAVKSNKKLHNLIVSIFPHNLRMLATHRMKSTKAKDKFKLSPEEREFVLSELKENLKKLKEKYGVEIERWGLEV